jgi:hypothetical protein
MSTNMQRHSVGRSDYRERQDSILSIFHSNCQPLSPSFQVYPGGRWKWLHLVEIDADDEESMVPDRCHYHPVEAIFRALTERCWPPFLLYDSTVVVRDGFRTPRRLLDLLFMSSEQELGAFIARHRLLLAKEREAEVERSSLLLSNCGPKLLEQRGLALGGLGIVRVYVGLGGKRCRNLISQTWFTWNFMKFS